LDAAAGPCEEAGVRDAGVAVRPVHVALAVLVAALWGFNFVVIQWGLGAFPPLLLAALRFLVAAIPCLFLPRPPLPWPRLILIGCAWFLGQFALLFTGMKVGMTPGLASVVMQSQAFFTILLASFVLRESPTARQIAGMLVAGAGLVCIGATVKGAGDVTPLGLALVLGASVSWACGNILMRRERKVDMLPMVVWLSLVPPLPLFALSLALEGPSTVLSALAGIGLAGIGSVLFLAVVATILCFGIWGELLKLYPASVVVPYALLVPLFGVVSSALVFGERFGPLRTAGIILILAGLAVIALPTRWLGQALRNSSLTAR
jgi:O-acetylserine/cysteine efflux transporter